jgi:hypothetical protein
MNEITANVTSGISSFVILFLLFFTFKNFRRLIYGIPVTISLTIIYLLSKYIGFSTQKGDYIPIKWFIYIILFISISIIIGYLILKMNKQIWIYLEALMLMLWIVTTGIFLYIVLTSGTRCLSNPLIYGSKVMSDKNNVNFTCICSGDNHPDYTIYVDKNHWEVKKGIELNLNFTGG